MKMTICYHELGRYLTSDPEFFCSTDDCSAIIKAWAYQGFKYISRVDLRRALGALIVCLKDPADEQVWLKQLAEKSD